MTRHLAFVTTELAPYTRGGAGVLVSTLASELRATGNRVSVVLCAELRTPTDDPDVIVADSLLAPGWDFGFMDLSMAAAETLSALHRSDPLDEVEMQDFDGIGFWTLTHRSDLGLADVPLSVRVHGPTGLQTMAMGASTFDLDVVAAMEAETLRMADRVVVPSGGIGRLVVDHYNLDPERIAIGAPIVRQPVIDARWRPGGAEFLVIGRLSEVKGSHDMIAAAVPVLRSHGSASVAFVGDDGWSVSANQPMSAWLAAMIPDDVRDRITFEPFIDHPALCDRIARCHAVVVPSRFETFNLAAHEARVIGAPVIVPSIPAFTDVFTDGDGVRFFEQGRSSLTEVLDSFASDPGLAAEVAAGGVPRPGEPLAPYLSMAQVRHVRSQGGVATAALARVEAIRFADRTDPSGPWRSLVARMPTGAIAAVKRVVPRSLKDWVKRRAGWDSLAEQRRWDARWAGLRAAVATGRWNPVGRPRVSVVIPCFNQGGFLHQAILSVFDQTFTDFEIVIVDDGSTDPSTVAVIDALDLPRVSVIRQENGGLPNARNTGIRASVGEYVVTLDADDMLAETYLEELAAVLDRAPNAGYAHCWAELFGDFQAVWATRPPNPYQLLLSNSVVGCVMLRRSAWEDAGGYDESMVHGNEDWDLWIRLSAAGWGSVQVEKPLFRYRKHGVSMSVETEGDYESAIRALPERLPSVYNAEYMVATKSEHYPLVTVIGPVAASGFRHAVGDDHQHLEIEVDELASLQDAIHGKYVVAWPADASADDDVVVELCRYLEAHPDIGAVRTQRSNPLTVVRTWSLKDPAAPSEVATIDVAGTASVSLGIGQLPDPAWHVPAELGGLPVQRQRPEEAGMIPAWVLGR